MNWDVRNEESSITFLTSTNSFKKKSAPTLDYVHMLASAGSERNYLEELKSSAPKTTNGMQAGVGA